MKMKLSNYSKPTPKKLRYLGDFALVMIPTFQGLIASAPEGIFTPTELWLLGAGASTFLVAIKFITKLFADEPIEVAENEAE